MCKRGTLFWKVVWSANIKLIGCIPGETSLLRWTGDDFCPLCSEQGMRFCVSLFSTGSIFCKETTKSVCVCVFFFTLHCSKQGQEFKLSVATLRLNLSQEIPREGGVILKRRILGINKKSPFRVQLHFNICKPYGHTI